jgi:hypothetical protein
MAGFRSAITAPSWLTAPSTRFARSIKGAIADNKRLGGSIGDDPQLNSYVVGPSVAVGRVGAISATPVSLKSAELALAAE